MRWGKRVLAAWLMLLGFVQVPVRADDVVVKPVTIRFGDHPGFGRIVFHVLDGTARSIQRAGNRLTVSVGAPSNLPSHDMPHNVRNMVGSKSEVVIDLVAGAGTRQMMVGGYFVVDILDPIVISIADADDAKRPAQAAKSRLQDPTALPGLTKAALRATGQNVATSILIRPVESEPLKAAAPLAGSKSIGDSTLPAPTPSSSAPVLKPETKVVGDTRTNVASLAAAAESPPNAGPGHMISLPFAPSTGAAAFRRGGEAVIVFDERKPIDLRSLESDPVFSLATIQVFPTATVMRLPLALPLELRLQHRGTVWEITVIDGGDVSPPRLRSLALEQNSQRFTVPASQPGMVVSVPDFLTGGILMVGTQRIVGEGVVILRRIPELVLFPSWQGIVVEALSDTIGVRATTLGFNIGAEGAGHQLVVSPVDVGADIAAAHRMSRSFDFPDLPITALIRRMNGAVVDASATPLQSRAETRRHVAESMVALGMGAEAQAVLNVAAVNDARLGSEPLNQALVAIAGLLAGRQEDSGSLNDERLNGSDEIGFWRAVSEAAQHEGSTKAAQVFANTLPLLLSYPGELRRRLLPLVAETMAMGGQPMAAGRLVDDQKDIASLDLARAIIQQSSQDDPTIALQQYDRLAMSKDRMVRFKSALRGAELRLAAGQTTAAQTADVLSKLLFAWRGDQREIDLRSRVAELLAKSEQWRPALQLLRETEHDFPEQGQPIHAQSVAIFAHAITPLAQSKLTPFNAVTLAEENPDLMPEGEEGQRLAEHIADQLLDLDLPARATPFLEKMVVKSPSGAVRATFAGRLAVLRLQQSDPAGAITVLKATTDDKLPSALVENRTIVFASALAKQGDLAGAMRALVDLDTAAADDTMATLAETAKSWADAVVALKRYATRVVPDTGPIDETQGRILLRLATAASQADDGTMVTRLRTHDALRFPAGPTADLFKLLTADPILGTDDLVRGAQEIVLARSIPKALPPLAVH